MAEPCEIDFKLDFSNLIITLGPNKNERLFNQLKKSFNEFKYGPIYIQEEKRELGGRTVSVCRIMETFRYTVRCIAQGEGNLPCDAEQQAVTSLMEKLYDSCYVIQANPEYFSKKRVPSVALNADPTQRHIYKVVYLKQNSRGIQFPQNVSGAVDYVENYNELSKYIEDHGNSDSKADLFILNVLKSDRKLVREKCQKNHLNMQHLVGCSDMGLFAFRNVATRDILHQLLTEGGKTVKYKLVGPRDRFGDNNITVKEEKVTAKIEEEVVINPWISDRLIIMERVNQWNELESNKEILFCSVRDCPDTQQFIIEKKRTNTAMIHAEAMIDMNVVGRARGYNEKQVKFDAAKDAMKNLTNCCYYIQVKQSYFGTSTEMPVFLRAPYCPVVTRLYRIADNRGEDPGKILIQFRSSPQEDLYFPPNFTEETRNTIHNRAVNMNFLVRRIGRDHILCVSKSVKPRHVVMELMATASKENEKYKLIIPPSKMQQRFKETTAQSWNERVIQPNEPICSGQETGQQQWNHKGASQSATESSAEKQNDTPSWVMKFIESAPVKNVKRHPPIFNPSNKIRPFERNTNFQSTAKVICGRWKEGDDVYSRYRFIAPTNDQPQVSNSDMNVGRVEHTPSETSERNNVELGNTTTATGTSNQLGNTTTATGTSSHTPTLSERLEKILSGKSCEAGRNNQMTTNSEYSGLKMEDESKSNMTSTGFNTQLEQRNDSTYDNRSNKRPCDKLFDFKEERGSTNKFSKLTTNPQRSEQERFSGNFSADNFNTRMFDSSGYSSKRSDVYEEVKIKEENSMNTSQFNTRPEATHDQYNNSQWAGNNSQQYDRRPNTSTGGQRNFSNLFDGVQPQAPSTSMSSFGPPPQWNSSRHFKRKPNNNFSKMEKYGRGKNKR